MEEVTLFLYLREKEYGERLLHFLLKKKNPWLHPELVTERKCLEKKIGREGERIAVLTDFEAVQRDGKKEIIYLTNETDRENKKIFQYQKAEDIYKELQMLLQLRPEGGQEKCTEKKRKGVYSVFSPEGVGTTGVSVYLSQYLGGYGKCLYLSLAGFPLYYGEELQGNPDFGKEGLSELLFSLSRENFPRLEERIRQPFGNAYMLPPFCQYKDILDCRPKDWEHFLTRLREDCRYDSLVVEHGQLMEHTLDYLEVSDKVFLPGRKGICGRIRNQGLLHCCRQENRTSLIDKLFPIILPPEISQWEESLAEQSVGELCRNGQAMSQVSGWMADGKPVPALEGREYGK